MINLQKPTNSEGFTTTLGAPTLLRSSQYLLVVLVVVLVVLVVVFVVVVASHYYYKENHHQDQQDHHQNHQKVLRTSEEGWCSQSDRKSVYTQVAQYFAKYLTTKYLRRVDLQYLS